jgi:hypothetical protein
MQQRRLLDVDDVDVPRDETELVSPLESRMPAR